MFTGVTTTTNAGDVLLVKLDANGAIEWQKMYEATTNDYPYAMETTSDGGYAIAGISSNFSVSNNGFLIKIDGSGNVLWHKTYQYISSGFLTSIQETPDGGFIAAGGAWCCHYVA